MSDNSKMLAECAKWRGIDTLLVTVLVAGQAREEKVELGRPRRRWERVARSLEALDCIAARGYRGETLIGSWEEEEEAQPDVDDETHETPAQASHRHHTRWAMELAFAESRRMFEPAMRLTTELVNVVVKLVQTKLPQQKAAADEQPHGDPTEAMVMGLIANALQNQTGATAPAAPEEGGGNAAAE